MKPRLILNAVLGWVVAVTSAQAGLEVTHAGSSYERDSAVTPDYLYGDRNINPDGNTSVRNVDEASLKWKNGTGPDANGSGYYQRNRDLGQVFNVPANTSLRIDAIILRTGNDVNAVMKGAPGAPVFIQFFQVTGTPVIHDNGTPFGTPAKHGFNLSCSKADDYLVGVEYRPLRVITGGAFPQIAPTSAHGDQPGHRQYLRWDLTGEDEIVLHGGEKGRRYAFLVGFTEPGPDRGFALSNASYMWNLPVGTQPELIKDSNGTALWCIRREGDGICPPTMIGEQPPAKDSPDYRTLVKQSLFPAGDARYAIPPTTDGYPDVCTYRAYEFYIETRPEPQP